MREDALGVQRDPLPIPCLQRLACRLDSFLEEWWNNGEADREIIPCRLCQINRSRHSRLCSAFQQKHYLRGRCGRESKPVDGEKRKLSNGWTESFMAHCFSRAFGDLPQSPCARTTKLTGCTAPRGNRFGRRFRVTMTLRALVNFTSLQCFRRHHFVLFIFVP